MRKYLAVMAVFAVMAAACGDDDASTPEPAEAPAVEEAAAEEPAAEEPAAEEAPAEEAPAEEPAAEEAPAEEAPAGLVVTAPAATDKAPEDLVFRFMNQIDGVPFYQRVNEGIVAAGEDLGIGDVLMTGPAGVDSALQVGTVETWITQGFDVIAVSSTDPSAMTPTINKAVDDGIVVVSWDVDAPDSQRSIYVNYWDPVEGPRVLWDTFMELLGDTRGEYAFITTALTSTTHAGWLDAMEEYQLEAFPEMTLIATESAEGNQTIGNEKAKAIIQANPDIVGLVSVDAGGTVGIAQATEELDLVGEVVTTGLSTPSQMVQFVESGTVPKFVLWDPAETGYLTVAIAFELVNGRDLVDGQELGVARGVTRSIPIKEIAGKPGSYEAIQGPALVFDINNVNDFGF